MPILPVIPSVTVATPVVPQQTTPKSVIPQASEPVLLDLPEEKEKPSQEKAEPASEADRWHLVAMDLASDSPLKFGWIEDSRFVERVGNVIVVEFPPSMESKTQTLFWPQAVKKIEELLSEKIGGKITLESRFTGEEPPAQPEPEPLPIAPPVPKAVSKPASVESKSTASEPVVPTVSPEELEAFKNDPLIQKALEIFKAEILVGS
jgi:DNA polymerase-3 subunit gamma/tau